MSPLGHLQYGWWFAHWGEFSRRDRAIIALAGAAPDLDGLTFLAGSDAFHRYHHILFHNIGGLGAAAVLAFLMCLRRPMAALLATFAFAMHVVEDYVTVAWNQYPWLPLSATAVNLADHLPAWAVQGVLQAIAMVFILSMTVLIYIRHGRTPLEILSPRLDRMVLNYALLPWRHHCCCCNRRARFRCNSCGSVRCAAHSRVAGLSVLCTACALPGGAGGAQGAADEEPPASRPIGLAFLR